MMLRILKQYYPIRNVFFVFGEGLLIFLSVYIAAWIVRDYSTLSLNLAMALKVLLITISCQVILYYVDLYDIKTVENFGELGLRLMQGMGFTSIFLAIVYFVFPETIVGSGVFLLSVVFVFIFIASWRFWYMLVLNRGFFNQRIIVIGSGMLAKAIIEEINLNKDSGYTVVQSIAIGHQEKLCDINIEQTVSHDGCKELSRLARKNKVKSIVVALDEKRGVFPTQALLECRVAGVDVLQGDTFYERLKGKLIVKEISSSWLIYSEGFEKSFLDRLVKRVLDLLLSVFLLIILFPLILLVALLIKIDSKGPVLFSQERTGRYHKPYQVYKFRSMVEDAEQESGPVWAEEEDPRITRVGKIIRKLRIDELPQLWNVLKGDMSFVGPRPERPFFVEQLQQKIPYFRERFTVKPGITGWAQVSYGYGASEEDAIEKLNYDLFYIKNMSILMDLVIVFRTVKIVLFGTGAR